MPQIATSNELLAKTLNQSSSQSTNEYQLKKNKTVQKWKIEEQRNIFCLQNFLQNDRNCSISTAETTVLKNFSCESLTYALPVKNSKKQTKKKQLQ